MHNIFWFAAETEQWMSKGNSSSCCNLCVTTDPPLNEPWRSLAVALQFLMQRQRETQEQRTWINQAFAVMAYYSCLYQRIFSGKWKYPSTKTTRRRRVHLHVNYAAFPFALIWVIYIIFRELNRIALVPQHSVNITNSTVKILQSLSSGKTHPKIRGNSGSIKTE